MSNERSEYVYTVTELAERWRVNRHTVTDAIRKGRLQAFKVGERAYRVRESEVERYERESLVRAAS
jgi:excisionase family DNA binding protein